MSHTQRLGLLEESPTLDAGTFQWKARDDKLKKQGLDPESVSHEQQRLRAEELKREIEKLKASRQKRDEERAQLMLARGPGSESAIDLDEENFDLQQLKRRALIRLHEGRPKHIDWLILIYLHASGPAAAVNRAGNLHAQHEAAATAALPLLPRDALSPLDVIDLLVQYADTHSASRLQGGSIASQLISYQHQPKSNPSLASLSVAANVEAKALENALSQLDQLKADIQLFIDLEVLHYAPEPSVDGYWRALLAIVSFKQSLLRNHQGSIHSLKLGLPEDEISVMFVGKSYSELLEFERQAKDAMNAPGAVIDDDYWQTALSRLALFKAFARVSEIFQSSLAKSKFETAVETPTEQAPSAEDNNLLYPAAKRRKLEDLPNTQDDMFAKAAASSLENGEEVFDTEVVVTTKHVGWMDKYRPRKPKYFNRVKTGYEWNKYNQTHYDIDNPPPKIVQGYKFNIFYPDLIDKSKTPQYFLEKSDSPDFVILRFHAGPPYEDIAFKIVNKEWEQSQKRGFKCQFSNGILYLWFNFKRYRYRR